MPPFLSVSPAGSVFMCRLCNVFSPSRSQLLAHCSQLHPQQEPLDDIIIALQPLVADPVEKLAGQSITTITITKKDLTQVCKCFGYTDNDCRIMSLLMLFSQVDVLQEMKKNKQTVLPFFNCSVGLLAHRDPGEAKTRKTKGLYEEDTHRFDRGHGHFQPFSRE